MINNFIYDDVSNAILNANTARPFQVLCKFKKLI